MQKRFLLSLLAVIATIIPLGLCYPGYAQMPAGFGGDSMTTPLQPIDNGMSTMDEPFSPSAPSRPAMSSVTSLQAGPTELEDHIAPKDYFQLTAKDTNQQGHSRRQARAVAITLKNTQAMPLQIMQGEVVNGLDEMTISEEKFTPEEIKHRALNFLMRGSNMISGFGVVGANNYGASAAMAPTPTMNFTNAAKSGSPEETVTGQFVNQIKDITLNPNQSYTFKVLLPPDANPQLKMTFRNTKTNQVMHF